MTEELELWACAGQLIRQHGEDAGTHAAMQADALLEAGDRLGSATWVRILNLVEQLCAPANTIH